MDAEGTETVGLTYSLVLGDLSGSEGNVIHALLACWGGKYV